MAPKEGFTKIEKGLMWPVFGYSCLDFILQKATNHHIHDYFGLHPPETVFHIARDAVDIIGGCYLLTAMKKWAYRR